ncbi:hypothetical protein [Litorivivens sp.]|uniref:bestrophin-like domain n=3 Tax=Litorivivens sp. TaxID=2020868 RepID=UPI00356AD819
MSQQLLYGFSSIAITFVLFALIIGCNEAGFRIGRFVQRQTNDEVKTLTGAIQGSILGLLALMLGFTFSMSMQRYDARNQALIHEANAIGTVMLRVQLLPEQFHAEVSSMLDDYVDLRIAASQIDLTQLEKRREFNQRISDLQNAIWAVAVEAAQISPSPVTSGAFITALNDMIDRQGERNAFLQMQVPEVVLLLLFVVFLSSGGILGYSSGLGGKRVMAPTVVVSFLISLIVFIIIDLDRPRRGLIQVDQSSLVMLQK